MSHTNADEELVRNIQDDWQEVDFRPSPPESTLLDAADDTDGKASRKREREISLEPATPKEAESVSFPIVEERRTPATKKNKLQLDSTAEEEETPPSSPNKSPIGLSISPPHESKVRQIREKVRILSWEERDKLPQSDVSPNNLNEGDDINGSRNNDTESLSNNTKHRSSSQLSESDSDDQEKNLKRKLADRSVSGLHLLQTNSIQEPIKRARDDAEEDVNPREKKRPTPPPDEQRLVDNIASSQSDPTESGNPQTKPNGFLSYASAKSPFANTAGPSLFGNRPSPSSTPSSGSSNAGGSTARNLTVSPSAEAGPSTINETSPLGVKRTGFEAFASVSPFAVTRPKSPTNTFLRSHVANKLDRSKSPPRRPLGAANAFSSYAGTTSPFAVPPVKKQKQEQDSGSDVGEGDKESINGSRRASLNNGENAEASEDDSDRQRTFSERLRASKQENESVNSEKTEQIIAVTEQERQTGEEHDDTLFQVRAKLYALDDQKQWKERGTGLLKLNVRKSDGGGARLLMRKEAVFTLLLNVSLFKGMRCSLAQDPRFVRFSIIEKGATVHYNLRLANAKVAGELLEEINANIPGEEERESSEAV